MASYKLRYKTADGKDRTITENHPKLDASQAALGEAAQVAEELYGWTAVGIDLNSDTTVWTPGA